MFSTFFEPEDYALPAIIEAIEQERIEARNVKAKMDHVLYAARLGLIVDALRQAQEYIKEGGAE